MVYKQSCVIDTVGRYKTIVLQFLEPLPDDSGEEWRVQHYNLAEGDTLVDVQQPSIRPYTGAEGFVVPRWNGTAWDEVATPEEIAAWEAAHPAPPPPAPTLEQRLAALEAVQLEQILGGAV